MTDASFPALAIRTEATIRRAEALLFEIGPGAVYPELDVHLPGAEEVFVVSGTFCDGAHCYPAGTFIHSPAGSSHVPQSPDGCVLFVFFPEG